MNNNNLASLSPKKYVEPIGDVSFYETPKQKIDFLSPLFPSFMFYSRASVPVSILSYQALRGTDDIYAWVEGSSNIFKALERTACNIIIEGLDNIKNVEGPCVFVANHMSTMETFLLPCIIQPRKPFIFVVKESLVRMPLFGNILKSRNPIVVSRKNARQDLKLILEQGKNNLDLGISVLIFPQSTRDVTFNLEKFNSIGAKLAKKANVPLLPLALKTNAWGQGKYIKDFGAVKPELPIHFSFGKAIDIEGNGKNAHIYTCDYITTALKNWG